MDSEHYLYTSNKGEVVICRNAEEPNWWDLLIGGKLVRPAFYSSPEQAAECANKRELADEGLNKLYVGLRVPSDLQQWKHFRGRRTLTASLAR